MIRVLNHPACAAVRERDLTSLQHPNLTVRQAVVTAIDTHNRVRREAAVCLGVSELSVCFQSAPNTHDQVRVTPAACQVATCALHPPTCLPVDQCPPTQVVHVEPGGPLPSYDRLCIACGARPKV